MPVIRGQARGPSLSVDQRTVLLEKLQNEISGRTLSGGKNVTEVPLIYEIPLERLDGSSDRIDVLVVWDELRDLRSEERTALILDAYGDKAERISQAMGITRSEAMEQHLLPYRLMLIDRSGSTVDYGEARSAMLAEGGIEFGNKVELLFPTRTMAEASLARLHERVPKGDWALGEMIH